MITRTLSLSKTHISGMIGINDILVLACMIEVDIEEIGPSKRIVRPARYNSKSIYKTLK